MKTNSSFTGYLNSIKFLFVFVVLISYTTSYLIEQKQEKLLSDMVVKYVYPAGMLNELKNIYDINILETIELMNNKKITRSDAADILIFSKKLIDVSWEQYYSKDDIQAHHYTKSETQVLATFKSNINDVNKQTEDLITRLQAENETISNNEILVSSIYKIKYLLDDVIIDNIKKVQVSKQLIKEAKNDYMLIETFTMLIILSVIFMVLSMIGKKMGTLNQELTEQAIELDDATKVKSIFLANMSHEIRTPLNAIIGFIDILIKKEVDGEKLKYLNIVANSGKSLINIISDILDYSKIESGKFIVIKEEFIVREVLDESLKLYEEVAMKKRITLESQYASETPVYMMGDKLRLKQIINNLLSNAIKFSKNNSTVILKAEYDENTDSVLVHIIDTGLGMSEEDINKLFTPFMQVGKAKVGVSGGTGLGLSISKDLIGLMGGEIGVTSKLGEGSDFYFSLPVYKEECIHQVTEEVIESYENVDYSNLQVLIVEDNKTNQMFLEILLDDLDIQTLIANDGKEAVDIFMNHGKFDLILMDENMPVMNGSEATKVIRELEEEESLAQTIIVAATANAMQGDKEKFISIGMNDYLSKPIDRDELVEVINKYCTQPVL